ncbi:transcription initiation factor iie subunit alpha [Acrodontium crateriforme]|uniref:Transcription initiation factor iie subunit alpha n=1 Tax=Acrodontium crateriforme TaxID=150365 RepID=A0AAQ3MBR2_9PEZI|nr:transcription initiation factor iie subunit alpha [Acrodontium crateriforme]
MASLAHELLRTTARLFYSTEHNLIIDALIMHSTLDDKDMSTVVGVQPKSLRKLCGKLREDGMITSQLRAARRIDGSASYFGGKDGALGKERMTQHEWYYLNFHRAIDSIKYRMYKLNKHIEGLGAPTTEKKDLICPRCKSQYTELEAVDKIDPATGFYYCHKCDHKLDEVEEDERVSENESMKRLNLQLEKILRLMQQIDATTVPENDFQAALSKQIPVERNDANPNSQRTEIVDLPNGGIQSSKGLELKPEKIAVQLQNDEDFKRETEAAEAQARKEKEARQNALPEWIAKSTISGDITSVGAKEERARREMEGHTAVGVKAERSEEKKPSATGGDEDIMAAYWEELAKAKEREAEDERAEEDDEDEEDEDEFEDVDVSGLGTNGAATPSGANGVASSVAAPSTEFSTPMGAESSNATDDERESKRVKFDVEQTSATAPPNGDKAQIASQPTAAAETPTASDEDDDDELEFENV